MPADKPHLQQRQEAFKHFETVKQDVNSISTSYAGTFFSPAERPAQVAFLQAIATQIELKQSKSCSKNIQAELDTKKAVNKAKVIQGANVFVSKAIEGEFEGAYLLGPTSSGLYQELIKKIPADREEQMACLNAFKAYLQSQLEDSKSIPAYPGKTPADMIHAIDEFVSSTIESKPAAAMG